MLVLLGAGTISSSNTSGSSKSPSLVLYQSTLFCFFLKKKDINVNVKYNFVSILHLVYQSGTFLGLSQRLVRSLKTKPVVQPLRRGSLPPMQT